MSQLFLVSCTDVQHALAEYLKKQRKLSKLSRAALAKRSTVPESTIKKFETTSQISLRQLLLLWQCLDDLNRLYQLTQNEPSPPAPQTIEEVLAQ